mgnify:CR=1 FL=1
MHFDEGDVYEAMTEDGQRYTITVGARNEDGTVQVRSSLDAEPVNVNPEQVGGAILADMDRARFAGRGRTGRDRWTSRDAYG